MVVLLVLLGHNIRESLYFVPLLAHIIIVYGERWLLINYKAIVRKSFCQLLRVGLVELWIARWVKVV